MHNLLWVTLQYTAHVLINGFVSVLTYVLYIYMRYMRIVYVFYIQVALLPIYIPGVEFFSLFTIHLFSDI